MFGFKTKTVAPSWMDPRMKAVLDSLPATYEITFNSKSNGFIKYREARDEHFTCWDIDSFRVTHLPTGNHAYVNPHGGFHNYEGKYDSEITDYIKRVEDLRTQCDAVPVNDQERIIKEICNYMGMEDKNIPEDIIESREMEFSADMRIDYLERAIALLRAAQSNGDTAIPFMIRIDLSQATRDQLQRMSDAITLADVAVSQPDDVD